MPSEDQKDESQQPQEQQHQQQEQQSNAKISPNSNATSTISNELANMTQAFKDKKKLVRRAFSMPRNLFRLSRRVKNNTNSTDTVATKNASSDGTKAASVQTNTITDNDESEKSNVKSADKCQTLPAQQSKQKQNQQHLPEAKPQTEQDNKHRLFRRSTWKKFLSSRFIVQSLNLKVNTIFPHTIFQSNSL